MTHGVRTPHKGRAYFPIRGVKSKRQVCSLRVCSYRWSYEWEPWIRWWGGLQCFCDTTTTGMPREFTCRWGERGYRGGGWGLRAVGRKEAGWLWLGATLGKLGRRSHAAVRYSRVVRDVLATVENAYGVWQKLTALIYTVHPSNLDREASLVSSNSWMTSVIDFRNLFGTYLFVPLQRNLDQYELTWPNLT
jgi:hypothetical protein